MQINSAPLTDKQMANLRDRFGSSLQENVSLAYYTTAHVGGKADALIPANSAEELAQCAAIFWEAEIPFTLIGGGSNILVSDEGYHGVILLNHARNIRIETHPIPPRAVAESGANFGSLARQAALRGLSGIEWATHIPGTVGGAIYGNAGAFGGSTQTSLLNVELIFKESGRQTWTADQMQYQLRSSVLKREHLPCVILSASFKLGEGDEGILQRSIAENNEKRKRTQPPGASTGSTFKNPQGDYAGRLIESAGLKGTTIGGAMISPIHANFIVNQGNACAMDYYRLIRLAQRKVKDQFGIDLELEIEFLGDFSDGEQGNEE